MNDQDLVDLVNRIVTESGRPEGFDASAWVSDWLAEPNGALGGRTPRSVLAEPGGGDVVAGLIKQMQSGAYA